MTDSVNNQLYCLCSRANILYPGNWRRIQETAGGEHGGGSCHADECYPWRPQDVTQGKEESIETVSETS